MTQYEITWKKDEKVANAIARNRRVLAFVKTNCIGKDNAMLRSKISAHLGISQRILRHSITHLNGLGEPILCSDEGIYYSNNPQEISRVAQRYKSMARNNAWKAEALERIAVKLK